MIRINLQEYYPEIYMTDEYCEVSDEIVQALDESNRAEAAYERRKYRYKAYYSLDRGDGIENEYNNAVSTVLDVVLFEEKMAAIRESMKILPEKQLARVYDYFFLRMTICEIAEKENVTTRAVNYSIKEGIRKMYEFLKKDEFSLS